jgi:hypothetical protein
MKTWLFLLAIFLIWLAISGEWKNLASALGVKP